MNNQRSSLKGILFILIIISLNSCKKNSIPTNESRVNKNLLVEIQNLSTTSSKRLAFGSLLPIEKLTLMKMQFDYILENVPLKSDQKTLIEKMKSTLTEDLYAEDEGIRAKYRNTIVKAFQEMCLQKFEMSFIITYFGSIINPNLDLEAQRNPPADNGCGCSTNSDYCYWGSHCDRPLGNYCTTTIDGCGFLLDYNCNGSCYQS